MHGRSRAALAHLLKVVAPVGAQRLLASDVPHAQLVPFELERLDAEAKGGADLVDVLTVELLDTSRLAGVVQTPFTQ